jgi:hypothetical protein
MSTSGSLPTVSAVITTYNYANFLPMTIDSALNQSYPDDLLEIVIMDDGSTDHTPELVREYQQRYPDRIRAFRQENAGYEAAASNAFGETRGEIVAILDSDDLWPRDKIASQARLFANHPATGLVYCDTEVIDVYGNVLIPSHWRYRGYKPFRGSDCMNALLGPPGNVALASTIAVRRNLLLERAVPIPKAAPFADWWITGRVAQVADIDYVEDVRVGYRMHAANITLGATGLQELREGIKSGDARRVLIAHGALDGLTTVQATSAWLTVENVAMNATKQAGTAYLPLARPTDADRATSGQFAEQAAQATAAGDYETAFRSWIMTMAHDPYDLSARQWFSDLLPLVQTEEPVPNPIPDARSFVTLSYLSEVIKEPQLVAAYAEKFTEDDDATLVISAIGTDASAAVNDLTVALGKEGLGLDDLPDAVLVTEKGRGTEVELERQAMAVLSRRRPRLRARAFGTESIDELRDLAVPSNGQ